VIFFRIKTERSIINFTKSFDDLILFIISEFIHRKISLTKIQKDFKDFIDNTYNLNDDLIQSCKDWFALQIDSNPISSESKNNLTLNDLDFIFFFFASLNIGIHIQNSHNLTIIKSFLFLDFQYRKDIVELFKLFFTSKLMAAIFLNIFFHLNLLILSHSSKKLHQIILYNSTIHL
jgi:hypothetical protein